MFDKEQLLSELPPVPSDCDFWVTEPTEGEFIAICNDFWWCLKNVGKGIKRQELSYAQEMYETVIRDAFNQIISWRIGMVHDFQVSIGKAGKFLPQFLSTEKWQNYLATYTGANETEMWNSLFMMIDLFKSDAHEVAEDFGFDYSDSDEVGIMSNLLNFRQD